MNMLLRNWVGLVMMLSIAGALPAAAQQTSAQPVLTLPATGTFARGGEFRGTISINRFERRANEDAIDAVGFVTGVLSRGNGPIGTAVLGEVRWPVRVSSGGLPVASEGAPGPAGPIRVAWSPALRPAATLLRVQATSCPVLSVALGANTVDLLGVQVALSPVTFDLGGVSGTPLGDVVCEAAKLVGNVAGVLSLLNGLLGLLTGLLGGLLGGLGEAIPSL